jgi:hypothetical protein
MMETCLLSEDNELKSLFCRAQKAFPARGRLAIDDLQFCWRISIDGVKWILDTGKLAVLLWFIIGEPALSSEERPSPLVSFRPWPDPLQR